MSIDRAEQRERARRKRKAAADARLERAAAGVIAADRAPLRAGDPQLGDVFVAERLRDGVLQVQRLEVIDAWRTPCKNDRIEVKLRGTDFEGNPVEQGLRGREVSRFLAAWQPYGYTPGSGRPTVADLAARALEQGGPLFAFDAHRPIGRDARLDERVRVIR